MTPLQTRCKKSWRDSSLVHVLQRLNCSMGSMIRFSPPQPPYRRTVSRALVMEGVPPRLLFKASNMIEPQLHSVEVSEEKGVTEEGTSGEVMSEGQVSEGEWMLVEKMSEEGVVVVVVVLSGDEVLGEQLEKGDISEK